MAIRIAVLSDIHGNAVAAKAVRKALKKEHPDHVIVAGVPDTFQNLRDVIARVKRETGRVVPP